IKKGKFCTIGGIRINIGLAMLQMSIANGLSFSDFCVVTIDAGRVAKRWCRKKDLTFQRTAAGRSQGHFEVKSSLRRSEDDVYMVPKENIGDRSESVSPSKRMDR